MKDYKKILEGVVNIVNNTEKSDIGFVNICTYLDENCPELKESEDERIRKEILNYIDKATGCKRWVAWLEKQGNTNIFDVPKISIKNAVEVTSRMQYIDDDIKPIAEFIMDYAKWNLHKDEWNQPTLTVPLFRVLDALIQKGKPYCACNQNIEKQGEHNPADKAEPKFKVDDWVVGKYPDDGSYIHKVVGVKRLDDGTYVYALDDNTYFSGSQESFYRLWSIKDAKPGDVLAAHECIVLFREIDGLNIRCFCAYHFMNNQSFYVNTLQNKDAFHPATKEQCSMIEKAIADAGYAFDIDKKELKKIENEEYDGEDYGIDGLWHAKNILEKTLGEVEGYQTDDGILEHECAISAVNKLYKEDAKIKNRWKPSDEHIHWLKFVMKRMPDTEKANEAEAVLKDLLEQLEEL